MVEEPALKTIITAHRSCQEEITIMVEQLDILPPIVMSTCLRKPSSFRYLDSKNIQK
jgi:hypothetical protein